MNENLTEIVFIIDRSGSMHGLEADTIGGFNSVIDNQKKLDGDAIVTTILFSNEARLLHDRLPLGVIKPMTEQDYRPGGSTALLDALGQGIEKLDNVILHMGEENRAAHIQFVVITDGMENASRRFRVEDIREKVEARRAQGWDFLFLGANMDAIAVSGRMGFRADRTVTTVSDSDGVKAQYEAVNDAMVMNRCCSMRSTSGEIEYPTEWKEKVERDRARRGK